MLVLTGHFGNFEVATAAGLDRYPQARGRFWFVRRPIKPAWLDALVSRRFRRAGFGVLPKRGGLEAILDRLNAGDLIVFPFDQHASKKDGVVVDFFGHPAGTFRSLAILALSTGAPVVPAASWREPNGHHVLRFEEPLAADRIRRRERGNQAQHPRLQRGARAHDPAPSGAVVVGAPPLEGRGRLEPGVQGRSQSGLWWSALAASGSRYAKLVERTRLPLVGETDFACGRSMCRACERMARANRARA